MSVIITGMDMPDNCEDCPCGYETEGVYRDECQMLSREWEKDATSNRPDWCPLVEIPKGASLVDRNQLLSEYDRQHKGPAGGARRIMEEAPTIFEEGNK